MTSSWFFLSIHGVVWLQSIKNVQNIVTSLPSIIWRTTKTTKVTSLILNKCYLLRIANFWSTWCFTALAGLLEFVTSNDLLEGADEMIIRKKYERKRREWRTSLYRNETVYAVTQLSDWCFLSRLRSGKEPCVWHHKLSWHSEDRVSSYIRIIKPTR